MSFLIFSSKSPVTIPNARINDYLDHVQHHWIPRYKTAPGLESVCLVKRPLVAYTEVLTITFWDSEDLLNHFFENCAFDESKNEYAGIEFKPSTYTLLMALRRQQPDCDRS